MASSGEPRIWQYYDQAIGQRVRTCRTQAGMALAEMAGQMRMELGALERIEDGQQVISAGQLLHLAHVLGVDIEMLVAVHY